MTSEEVSRWCSGGASAGFQPRQQVCYADARQVADWCVSASLKYAGAQSRWKSGLNEDGGSRAGGGHGPITSGLPPEAIGHYRSKLCELVLARALRCAVDFEISPKGKRGPDLWVTSPSLAGPLGVELKCTSTRDLLVKTDRAWIETDVYVNARTLDDFTVEFIGCSLAPHHSMLGWRVVPAAPPRDWTNYVKSNSFLLDL